MGTLTEALLDPFGVVDIVVNNAGITGFLETPGAHDPEHLDLASWHTVHATNLDAAYAALYRASDEAKYLTGIELTLGGGMLAGASAAPSQ